MDARSELGAKTTDGGTEPIPIEVWRGNRKVTVYPGENVLRSWGPNMETEMSDEPFSLGAVQCAMDWLYETTWEQAVALGKAADQAKNE